MKKTCLVILVVVFAWFSLSAASVPEVTGIFSNGIQVNRGSVDGVVIGSKGKVFYKEMISGKEINNYIALFEVTTVDKNSCQARVTQKQKDPRIGYFVQFTSTLKPQAATDNSSSASGQSGLKTGNPNIELAFWESIKESQNPDDFRAYLKKFPRGVFADLANNRIKTLSAASAAEAEIKYGWLEIGAYPFADVEIDGKALGEVPPNKTEKLTVGEHTIVFLLDGWDPVTKKVKVEDNVKLRIFHKFKNN
jgi:hypothetical protein